MRQIGATGNLRMGCMRELPVGQGSARVRWGSEKSAAVTAGSLRIDSGTTAAWHLGTKPPIWDVLTTVATGGNLDMTTAVQFSRE
jgi:hypothetical protein